MSFQQGLSGLNAASRSLETIGNNVANANTVGFKGSQAQFADVYASSLTGAGGSQIGIGTKVSQIFQQFTQGNITASNNPLDVAINGGGFFRMSTNGTISYTRNGQFQLDREGFIVNASGARLTGYTADMRGVLSTGAPGEINISTADLAPQATSSVTAQINLDSRMDVPEVTPFDIDEPLSYNSSSSVTVYDSLGNAHVMQSYYVKTSTPGQWEVYASCDGVLLPPVAPAVTPGRVGTLQFNGDGILTSPITPLNLSIDLNAVAAGQTPPETNNATAILPIELDYEGSTQFGASFGVRKLVQDGFTSGRLSAFNIGADGIITGRYTNGESATLGQIVLANFTNPNGLQPLGNNLWAESSTSGSPLVGTPGASNMGVLQASSVEDSNVDLTAELVNMITAQRVYQANAQTIKTQDQVLQTLVNLR
ncbi:MAG TPA: flagellar hook protein FlgE [Noviherbaspirillum sp.]|nr:flagellar hook protein FlgE [Noviherbaspirillum sp.]